MKNRSRTTALALSVTAVAAAAGVGLAVLPGDGDDGASSVRESAGHGSAHGHAAHGADDAAPAGGLGTLSGSDVSSAGATFFAGSLNGANEVPVAGGPAVGDKDGKALALMRIKGTKVSFAFSFRGIATPTAAHIHQGVRGKNGDIKIPFFAKKAEGGRTTVTGKVTVKDKQLLNTLRTDPNGFYFNLHTGEFPGGAVRGQVHKLATKANMHRMLSSSRYGVIKGSQVYACTKQDDGKFALTQNNVRARLEGRIAHFFAKPGPAGPARVGGLRRLGRHRQAPFQDPERHEERPGTGPGGQAGRQAQRQVLADDGDPAPQHRARGGAFGHLRPEEAAEGGRAVPGRLRLHQPLTR